MRRVATVGLAVIALASTACGGPKEPLNIDTAAAPVDLVLGEREAVEEAPVGPLSVSIPDSVAPFFPIAGTPPKQPTVPLGPCPDFDPLEPVPPAQTGFLTGGPPNASYTYRAKTSQTVGQMKQDFAGDSTWKVTSKRNAETGGIEVTLDVTVGSVKSQRVFGVFSEPVKNVPLFDDPANYDLNAYTIDQYNGTATLVGLVPLPRTAPALGIYGPPGIYLISQTMGDETFKPITPIALVHSPIYRASITSYGSDGQRAMTFTSTVEGTDFVNACGTKLETTRIKITNGQIGSLNDQGEVVQVAFEEVLNFGIQFGGLLVRDEGKVSASTERPGGEANTVSRTFSYTINTEPKPTKR